MAHTTAPPPPDGGTAAPLYAGMKVFGVVVLLLMLVSILYAGWIALANWGSIAV